MTNTIKFKYDKKDNNILYLKEYLFCTDEENQDLFIIFKFRNAYKQVLYAFEAEVTQYDEENNVLETSIFTYNNCEIRKKSDFVPYKKLHAYADCKSISVKIIYAKYSNKTFNEEYLANPNLLKKLEKDEKKKTKKEIKANKKEIKASFKKNKIKNKNKFKRITLPLSFIVILLLFFAFFYFQIINYERVNKTFVNENITYEIIKDTITVKKVDSDTKNVRIPKVLYSYNVTDIGKNAFEGSNVEQVIVDGNSINIDEYAFADCKNLKTISSANSTQITLNVKAGAFKNCTSLTAIPKLSNTIIESETFYGCTGLTSINLPNIEVVEANAFKNCTGLKSINLENAIIKDNAFSGINVVTTDGLTDISYKDNESTLFGNMFGVSNEIITSVNNINMKMEKVSKAYFNGLNIANLTYDKNTFFEFGSLSNTNIRSNKYELSDRFEVLNNEIISCNKAINNLTIDGSYTSILKNAIKESMIYSLTLNAPYLTYPTNFITDESSIQNLTINCGRFSGGVINKNNIYKISINASEVYGDFSDIFTKSDFENISVYGDKIPLSFFDKVINVNCFTISNEMEIFGSTTFKKININKLIIPILSTPLVSLGIDAKEISISGITDNPTSGFINGLNKVEKVEYYVNNSSSIIPQNFVINCSNLKELYVECGDNDCTFTLPFIGGNCPNLRKVSVPFVGGKISSLTSYNSFNESAKYTERLRLLSQNNGFANLLENNDTLCELDIKIISIYKSLSHIPESLETLVIRDTNINKYTFNSGLNIDNLVLLNCNIYSNSLDNLDVKTLFVNNISDTNYVTFNRALANQKYYSGTTSSIVDGLQAYDYDNYKYDIVYNNNVITYNGFYIYNISSYISNYLNDKINCSLYNYNNKNKNDLFITYNGNTNIFAFDNETININVINPIIVTCYDYYGNIFYETSVINDSIYLPIIPDDINNLSFIGWKDQYGNIISSTTEIKNDIKLYPIYKKKLVEKVSLELKNGSEYYYSSKYDTESSINVMVQVKAYKQIVGTYSVYKNDMFLSLNSIINGCDIELGFNANDVYCIRFSLDDYSSSGLIINKTTTLSNNEEAIKVNIDKTTVSVIEYSNTSIAVPYKQGYEFIGYYDQYGNKIYDESGKSITINYPDTIIARYNKLY